MSGRSPIRQLRHRVLAAIAGAGVLTLLGHPAAQPVEAAWVDLEHSTGAFTAGTVSPVTAMTCTAGALAPVTFNWTAPVGGLTRTGYRAVVSGGFSREDLLAANTTSMQYTSGLLGLGTGTFSLYAVHDPDGAGPVHWESVVKTGTFGFVTSLLSSCSVP